MAAMTMAVECSAALPMMGRMTKPTKDSERPRPAAAPWRYRGDIGRYREI